VLLPPFQIGFVQAASVSVPPYDTVWTIDVGDGVASGDKNTGIMHAHAITAIEDDSVGWVWFTKAIQAVTGQTMTIDYTYWIKGQVKALGAAWAAGTLYIKVFDPDGNEINSKTLFTIEAWGPFQESYPDESQSGTCSIYISSSGEHKVETGLMAVAAAFGEMPGLAFSNFVDPFYAKVSMHIMSPEPPATPSTPSGPSSGYRWKNYWYTTCTTDPDDDRLRYQFDWGDGSSEWIQGDYASGEPASWYHRWNSIGSYLVRTRAKDATGLYSSWSPYKKVNIIKKPGFPCPTLFVWNGSEYAEVGVLGIHDDSDITFLQGIDQTFVPENHLYKLSMRELDEFTSHIDYVKLYVVDDEVEKYECHLAQAVHSELGHVEGLLLHDDDKRVDLNPLQTIDLKFTAPNINEIAYFIFEINGYNIKP